jgi:hypothetical protein
MQFYVFQNIICEREAASRYSFTCLLLLILPDYDHKRPKHVVDDSWMCNVLNLCSHWPRMQACHCVPVQDPLGFSLWIFFSHTWTELSVNMYVRLCSVRVVRGGSCNSGYIATSHVMLQYCDAGWQDSSISRATSGRFCVGSQGAAQLHPSVFWLSVVSVLQEHQIELSRFHSRTRVEWLVNLWHFMPVGWYGCETRSFTLKEE